MGARMDNTIHVQVQIVEFNLIRIGFCDVRRLFNTIAFLRLKQNNKYALGIDNLCNCRFNKQYRKYVQLKQ